MRNTRHADLDAEEDARFYKEDIYSKMGNQFGVRGEQTLGKCDHESHFHYRSAMKLRF